jgi:hypothetical protein
MKETNKQRSENEIKRRTENLYCPLTASFTFDKHKCFIRNVGGEHTEPAARDQSRSGANCKDQYEKKPV